MSSPDPTRDHPAPPPLASHAELAGLSGMEFMQAMAEGRLAGPPIAAHLSFTLDRAEDGLVVFRGAPAYEALNPMGAVHGGWYGTLLDSAMGCAVMTRVPRGRVYTTLEYKVNILRPVPLGTQVLAEGRLQHAGRTTGVAVGEIRGAEDGRLYATGSTTCIIMDAPKG